MRNRDMLGKANGTQELHLFLELHNPEASDYESLALG
jgi:hypothetical protein